MARRGFEGAVKGVISTAEYVVVGSGVCVRCVHEQASRPIGALGARDCEDEWMDVVELCR
jgi:hypothetical protein